MMMMMMVMMMMMMMMVVVVGIKHDFESTGAARWSGKMEAV